MANEVVLVTGGAGFIGSHVVDSCIEVGHDVVVVDDLLTGRRSNLNPRARFYEMDERSRALAEVFDRERPQVVSHHAAQVGVRRSVADPLFDADVNVLGSLNLLECCRAHGDRGNEGGRRRYRLQVSPESEVGRAHHDEFSGEHEDQGPVPGHVQGGGNQRSLRRGRPRQRLLLLEAESLLPCIRRDSPIHRSTHDGTGQLAPGARSLRRRRLCPRLQ